MSSMTRQRRAPSPDIPTVAAIAVVCGLASSIVHEALGHGVAALLLGAHVQHVSSVDLAYDETTLSPVANRVVAAAGVTANFVAGALATAWSRRTRSFALWLFATISFLVAGGYMMALSFVPFGDMNAIATGLPAEMPLRVLLTLAGAAISFATARWAARTIAPFAAGDRRRALWTLCLVPYVTIGIAYTVAGAFNPDGHILVAESAMAASFGGNAFLLWIPSFAARRPPRESASHPLTRDRSWLIAGACALIVLIAALGPGLPR